MSYILNKICSLSIVVGLFYNTNAMAYMGTTPVPSHNGGGICEICLLPILPIVKGVVKLNEMTFGKLDKRMAKKRGHSKSMKVTGELNAELMTLLEDNSDLFKPAQYKAFVGDEPTLGLRYKLRFMRTPANIYYQNHLPSKKKLFKSDENINYLRNAKSGNTQIENLSNFAAGTYDYSNDLFRIVFAKTLPSDLHPFANEILDLLSTQEELEINHFDITCLAEGDKQPVCNLGYRIIQK